LYRGRRYVFSFNSVIAPRDLVQFDPWRKTPPGETRKDLRAEKGCLFSEVRTALFIRRMVKSCQLFKVLTSYKDAAADYEEQHLFKKVAA
jgi:hypothetical protein